MKQFAISLKNEPGQIANICETLGNAGVNIKSLAAGGIGEHGVLHLVTADELTASKALKKAGYESKATDIMIVELLDRPGELGKVTRKLALSNINIDSIYLLGKINGKATLAIMVDNEERVREILSK